MNLPASRFLRPHTAKVPSVQALQERRIKDDLTYAARQGLAYHLRRHPHNFGALLEENIGMLRRISITSRLLPNVTACRAGIWRRVHSINPSFRIMSSFKKIVLLGREDRQTAIVYNSLRSEFPLAAVVVEERESRLKFVKRRAKKLGLGKALGQIAFRLAVVPWLRATSRRRVEEILRQFELDASPVPAEKLIKSIRECRRDHSSSTGITT